MFLISRCIDPELAAKRSSGIAEQLTANIIIAATIMAAAILPGDHVTAIANGCDFGEMGIAKPLWMASAIELEPGMEEALASGQQ